MRSLVYFVAATLDGYIAGVDGGDPDFFPFEGPHVADLLAEFPRDDPRTPPRTARAARRHPTLRHHPDGRTTYDIGRKAGLTSPYPHLRQIAVSSSITAPPDPAVEVLGQDVIGRVRTLKAEQGKDMWLAGGGRLAAFLVDEIDELILKVNLVVLGAGTPLFDGVVGPRPVTLTGHKVYPNGFALMRYRWSP
jgi:dihydrofolate reductase